MPAIVPILYFALLVVTYAARCSDPAVLTRWRAGFLAGAVTWGLTATAITEVLSLFRLITFGWLLTLWVVALLLSAVICAAVSTRERLTALLERPSVPRLEFWCVAAVATLAAIVGLLAFLAPPNTPDAMAYHMPRVMHWIQNQTVDHYPTNILRQIVRPPWSGFAIMQFQVLTGGDQMANLVQWFSMIGSVIGVSLIAGHLGADTRGQLLAALIAATIPMGILQASSTQNDYVTTFWLVCLTHYVFRFNLQPCRLHALGVGASLALALLTKGTAYLYALPLLAWCTLSAIRTLRWRMWRPLLVIAGIVVTVNLGHASRNFDLSGNPLGTTDEDRYFVSEVVGVRPTVSNVIRNMSLHVGTPSERVNGWIYRGIKSIHVRLLGMPVSDPRITADEFYQRPFAQDEDSAGNPIHLGLLMAALALLFAPRGERTTRDLAAYATVLMVAFLIFCSYLKWNPWNSRLHLTLFVLWSPLIAVVLLKKTSDRIAFWTGALLMTSSTLYVFRNETRPLIGIGPKSTVFNTSRVDQVFEQFADVQPAYLDAARVLAVQGCADVGLETGLEYPVWVLLQKMMHGPIRIEHAYVENISTAKMAVPPFAGFSPCAVLVDSNCSPPCSLREGDKEALLAGSMFTKAWSSGKIAVFTRPRPPA